MMTKKEAKARLKINMLLSDAGWKLLDDENGPANVDVENKVELPLKNYLKLLKSQSEKLLRMIFVDIWRIIKE